MNKYLLAAAILIAPITLYSSDIKTTNKFKQLELKYNKHQCFLFQCHWNPIVQHDLGDESSMTINYVQSLNPYTGYNLNITPVVLMILKNKEALLFKYKEQKSLLPFAAIDAHMVEQLENISLYETPVFNITYQENPDKTIYYVTRKISTQYKNTFRGHYPIHFFKLSFLKTRVVIRYLTIAVIILSSVFLKIWG